MDDGTLYSIGELARRTGLTVKTIRLYSDRGLVPPADRTPAGYRRYGPDAVARLALVRTLRELGLGLDTIRRVLDRDLPLGRVAAEHAAALDAQIGILRLRRAVLVAAAGREATFEEMERMHQLATLSEAERRRLIDDFLGTVFGGPVDRTGPAAAARRSLTPELPERPTEEQVTAWVELAELSLDPDFRARMRGWSRNMRARGPTAPPCRRGRAPSPSPVMSWRRPCPRGSNRGRRRPSPSSPGSPRPARSPSAGPTTPSCAPGWCVTWPRRTIPAGTGTPDSSP